MVLPSKWDLPAQEDQLQRSAFDDLEALSLLDRATAALVATLNTVPVPPPSSKPEDLQHNAIWMMCIAAFRAARAAIAVLGRGYEEQAIGYVRLLGELFHRSKKVYDDKSGQYAKRWLDGKPPQSGAKLAGQEFWEMLSGPVHADPRGVLDWIAVSGDDGSTSVVLGPERRPEVTNAHLAYMAGLLRDLACTLLRQVGRPISALDGLTQAIQKAHDVHGLNQRPDGQGEA